MSQPLRSRSPLGVPLPSPWSPLTLTVITLFLPAGAIVGVRNLVRLGQFDARQGRQLMLAMGAVLSIGLAVLLAASLGKAGDKPQLDTNSTAILSLGIAAVTYLIQRKPFINWRTAHQTDRTAPWWIAVGLAAVYQICIVIPAVILALVFKALFT